MSLSGLGDIREWRRESVNVERENEEDEERE
jgi:hypothetical protein